MHEAVREAVDHSEVVVAMVVEVKADVLVLLKEILRRLLFRASWILLSLVDFTLYVIVIGS